MTEKTYTVTPLGLLTTVIDESAAAMAVDALTLYMLRHAVDGGRVQIKAGRAFAAVSRRDGVRVEFADVQIHVISSCRLSARRTSAVPIPAVLASS